VWITSSMGGFFSAKLVPKLQKKQTLGEKFPELSSVSKLLSRIGAHNTGDHFLKKVHILGAMSYATTGSIRKQRSAHHGLTWKRNLQWTRLRKHDPRRHSEHAPRDFAFSTPTSCTLLDPRLRDGTNLLLPLVLSQLNASFLPIVAARFRVQSAVLESSCPPLAHCAEYKTKMVYTCSLTVCVRIPHLVYSSHRAKPI
jgi:hypothetical protein